jgi:hypothetical protein
MEWVTADAAITLDHRGSVETRPSQRWVTVGGAPVLVERGAEGRDVVACPNYRPTM